MYIKSNNNLCDTTKLFDGLFTRCNTIIDANYTNLTDASFIHNCNLFKMTSFNYSN